MSLQKQRIKKSRYFYTGPSLYNIHKTFQENVLEGPFFYGPIPERTIPKKDQWIDFLDYKIMSPIGIAACPLMATGKGIKLAAQLGFDVLTFKTVRSYASAVHPLPNFVPVNVVSKVQPLDTLHARSAVQSDTSTITMANSFGNASHDAHTVATQISQGRASLLPGQVLIASVYGTTIEEFIQAAQLVFDAGAHVIEMNLSCPNVKGGLVYGDISYMQKLVRAVVSAVRVPVIAKLGFMQDAQHIEKVLVALAREGVRGICGINTVPVRVINDKQQPMFGVSRIMSGLSGAPIHRLALEFIQQVVSINVQHNLDFTLLATGGVTTAEQFDNFLHVGATAALSATGALFNPYLAAQWHNKEQ